PALAGSAQGGAGQIAGPGRRVLCLRRKRRPGPQGAGDAPAAAEMAVASSQRTRRDEEHPRATANETRGRPRQGPGRMAPRRRQGRQSLGRLHLRPQPQQAAYNPPPRRPLSAAHQSHRKRPRYPLAILHPARRCRRSLQNPQSRPRHPTRLSSRRTPDRGPYLHRLPRLLLIRHAAAPPSRAGTRADRSQCSREICRRPDDRRSSPNYRRPRTRAHPLPPAGARTAAPDQPAQFAIAAPAAAQAHCRRPSQPAPAVVKNFQTNPLIYSGQPAENGPNPRRRSSLRERDLPAHVVMYYVIALALYMQASYREVLRCLLEGLQWLRDPALPLKVAGKSGISQARTRLGWPFDKLRSAAPAS